MDENGMPRLALVEQNSMQRGKVHGPLMVEELVCQRNHMLTSKGIFLGSDPLKHALPILLLQMALIILTTRLIFRVIKPLKQGMITAQVLAGVILGPTVLGQSTKYTDMILPVGGKVTLQTLSSVGLIIHVFLLGLKIDASIIRKAGSKAFLIGTASYIFPFTIGQLSLMLVSKTYNLSKNALSCLGSVIPMGSMTTFPVITTVLAELNILNSELGRLATNCSIVCEACHWVTAFVYEYRRQRTLTNFGLIMWIVALLFIVFFVCRPVIIWLTKRKAMRLGNNNEVPFFPILATMFMMSLAAETLGVHAAFGAFWFGVSLPAGPPLGTVLATKLDTFATALLLPSFISISGLQTNFFVIEDVHAHVVEAVILVTYSCKFIGTAVASAYCHAQAREALCLGFLMCCQGVIEVYTIIMWNDAKLLDTDCFNLLLTTLIFVTGISRILVVFLYDPSKRYKSASKRTILTTRQRNLQLRLLLCIYDVDNIPSLMNLLEVSYPTRFSPISVCTLHLVDLKGRAHAVLVPHHQMNKLDPNTAKSTHIANAFQRFEQQNQGTVIAQHFTAVAPFSSISDDVCTLALDKKATLIVVPFHKNYSIDASVGYLNPAIRNINLNVLDKAPCSVGVFIDRGETMGRRTVLTSETWKSVAVLYIGGRDDAEALAFCMRMAEQPEQSVTMIHFKHKSSLHDDNGEEDYAEIQQIQEFRTFAANKSKVKYIEEIVKDGVETTQVISTLGDTYDMVVVGRNHDLESAVLYGLTDWSECPELGVVGDMLASPDFMFSVLVVHQQPGESLSYDNSYTLPVTHKRVVVGDSLIRPRFSTEDGFTTIDLGKD